MNEEPDIYPLVKKLSEAKPGTDEYDKLLKQLNQLVYIRKELRNLEKPSRVKELLNNSALIGVAGNLLVALLMLNFEKADIITSSVRSLIRSK